MTLAESERFALTVRTALADTDQTSIYGLYLLSDCPKATVYRWLSGERRIPVHGARKLVEAMRLQSERFTSLADKLSELIDSRQQPAPDDAEESLRVELRARGLPVERTLAALRSAKILPR